MKHFLAGGLAMLGALATLPVQANPDVISREYKLILDASQFHYQSEQTAVQSLMQAVKPAIENAIDRNVTGTATLDHDRQVRFFDTPGSCMLEQLGYSFRERVENGDSEVTLKFRSPDRYIADFEDLSSSTNGAESKLEADVGATSSVPFKVVYSHSTKAPNSRTLNHMDDVHAHFPGFEDDYGLDDNLTLSVVGGLTVTERVYRNVDIDLGQHDAEISITLWYAGTPSGSQSPAVAEISFKYEDPSADYTRKVVNRARQAFDALRGLSSWVEPDGQTKTRFVYQYDSSFCQP
ncbi:hypothetical protein A11A3_07003 [Alcanivorax hongdengensis A-11-3]|uniref:Uncharacterized protein n=1 Tax=Alcanivorax hongdengensis A-11-3 TaxID=1177179 RepID=L0WCR4_9GAMM|nr:hypothetical protein [Alcanivorax hongdengensis]EKF74751.1 hypothetical protein A11A3_07003 [Alcanivorax hongdengensis A-11-3]